MKRLILFRHAKSSWKHHDLSDFDRPLNSRGKHNAPVMAKRLVAMNLKPDLIVSSPAKRAIKTAAILASHFGYDKDEIISEPDIYEGSLTDLYAITRGLDDRFSLVMVFGHNPGLTYFANSLTRSVIENVPTCGCVCVELHHNSWNEVTEGAGSLAFFDFPKNTSGPIQIP